MTANRAASVLARLKNRARADGEELQYVLVRYANERLLYRLSVGEAGRAFVLKGATLFLGWHGRVHRVTRDIDLLGFGDPSPGHLEEVFRTVAAHPFEDDAIVFDAASVRAEPIRDGMTYGGVRVTMRARLDRADLAVQVDVGFGDAVEPAPVVMDLPTLLDLPAPRLWAYPREVVIAEKVEAMVRLGRENSRMKDFYDVWLLLRMMPGGDDQPTPEAAVADAGVSRLRVPAARAGDCGGDGGVGVDDAPGQTSGARRPPATGSGWWCGGRRG